MASVGKYKAKDGRIHTRILFVDPADGRRRTLRLGRVNKEQIATVKGMVERLVKSWATGTPDAVAGAWLAGLGDAGYAKLVKVGLAEPRVSQAPEPEPAPEPGVCIGDFLDGYMKDRDDLKNGSKLVYGHTRRNLIAFFGREKPLKDITEYDGEQWTRYLLREGLAKATIRKRTTNAKAFFNAAVKQNLIPANPLAGLKSSSVTNKAREYFLSCEDAEKMLDACPDTQWRLIFALCRYAGLRCPSEVLGLRWQDVNWDRSRMLVHSPKTEHHEGHESRMVPIFPELRPYLMAAFEEAEPGTEHVITKYRQANINLRTQLHRIIRKAGLTPWPRTFQNLRSTRETELTKSFPLHVVVAWIGNTPKVAQDHYLQVRDEDFEQAAQTPSGAAHRTAQSEVESGCKEPQGTRETDYANRVIPVETADCELVQVGTKIPSGANEIRTHDLLHAMQALSQLSYGPVVPSP
jgi:integrase